jgi:hypothetical protein
VIDKAFWYWGHDAAYNWLKHAVETLEGEVHPHFIYPLFELRQAPLFSATICAHSWTGLSQVLKSDM